MPFFTKPLPLSLYIHLPWCARKCPYCDFNSHQAPRTLPEDIYVTALLQELNDYQPLVKNRSIKSIFFGGGTPSLFSGKAIKAILDGVRDHLLIDKNIEITLEANPGRIDESSFEHFLLAGVNRLSLGVQSFQDDKLQALGRIHDSKRAIDAITLAKKVGFTKFNIDLMYGLPNQTIDNALYDLKTALSFDPPHLSWYQLTIEPNTLFYHARPTLPTDDLIWTMQLNGQALLKASGLNAYEISAYAKSQSKCVHNLNYWEFGDYLGIGAGAHSKITDHLTGNVLRFSQVKHPKDYLDPAKRKISPQRVIQKDLIFEFMLNALRLTDGVSMQLFRERTGIPVEDISRQLSAARQRGLLDKDVERLCPTPLGFRFLNDLTAMFLPSS